MNRTRNSLFYDRYLGHDFFGEVLRGREWFRVVSVTTAGEPVRTPPTRLLVSQGHTQTTESFTTDFVFLKVISDFGTRSKILLFTEVLLFSGIFIFILFSK